MCKFIISLSLKKKNPFMQAGSTVFLLFPYLWSNGIGSDRVKRPGKTTVMLQSHSAQRLTGSLSYQVRGRQGHQPGTGVTQRMLASTLDPRLSRKSLNTQAHGCGRRQADMQLTCPALMEEQTWTEINFQVYVFQEQK